MTAQIINGKDAAEKIRQELKQKITDLTSDMPPVLAVIQVGDNEASKIYVRNKRQAAAEIGMGCEVVEFSDTIGENALLESINELNDNPHINGIIVQLPLPQHINPLHILSRIAPEKDVDGFSPYNIGLLSYNNPQAFISATAKGVLHLLQNLHIDLAGKHAVIIGRSNIVGKPMAALLLSQDCTVTVAHSHTVDLPSLTKQADILVVACGCPKLVKADWVKEGAVVIDVGINRVDGKLCGDVDFDTVKEKASFITPVPKGVGPMTVAMLLENTYQAFIRQSKEESSASCTCGHHHHHCHCH
jgi:methylenetetrahydrofolate dehydrogenase (NADP+)/methenyltetrahydrofolate cyclohydrolase